VNGANSYVCKPVGFGEFEAAVQELALYWLTLNNGPSPGDGGRARGLRGESGLAAARPGRAVGLSNLPPQYDPPEQMTA
jgi:hypothetical protein